MSGVGRACQGIGAWTGFGGRPACGVLPVPVRGAPGMRPARPLAAPMRPGHGNLRRLCPGRVRVQPAPQIIRDKVHDDPPGAPVQVPEDAFAVAQAAQHGLMLLGRVDAEQRHDARDLGPLGGAEREDR